MRLQLPRYPHHPPQLERWQVTDWATAPFHSYLILVYAASHHLVQINLGRGLVGYRDWPGAYEPTPEVLALVRQISSEIAQCAGVMLEIDCMVWNLFVRDLWLSRGS